MSRVLRALIPLFLALALASCNGSVSSPSPSPTPTPDPAAGLGNVLPAVSTLRSASVLTDNVIAPTEQLFSSPGYAIEGSPGFELGRMDSSASDYQWAIFSYAPGSATLVDATFHLVDAAAVQSCYMGMANFASGRWELSGPYAAAETSLSVGLPLDGLKHLSSSGPASVYLAVLAPRGSNVALQGIVVRTNVTGTVNGDFSWWTSLADISGRPAISYSDPTTGKLRYVRALDADGTAWGSAMDLDTVGFGATHTALAEVNGRPAILYTNNNSDLCYLRASDANGDAWPSATVLDSGENCLAGALQLVSGNPAACYYDSDHGDLRYIRALDADGTNWDLSNAIDSEGDTGRNSTMALVNTHPAITYFDNDNDRLRYVQSSDMTGLSWGSPVTLEDTGSVGLVASMQVVNGRPAVAYDAQPGLSSELHFVRALDADGTVWGEPNVVDADGNTGAYCSLQVIGGLPLISYFSFPDFDHGLLKLVKAENSSGDIWELPRTLDSDAAQGGFTSLAEIDGQAAVSYLGKDSLSYTRVDF